MRFCPLARVSISTNQASWENYHRRREEIVKDCNPPDRDPWLGRPTRTTADGGDPTRSGHRFSLVGGSVRPMV